MGDDTVARALARDYRTAELSPADRAMLEYAVKLTRHPRDVEEVDVEALRGHGFSDAAILDVCQVTAYYNYVNRLADGLGVELEDGWTPGDMVLTRGEFEDRAAAPPDGRGP